MEDDDSNSKFSKVSYHQQGINLAEGVNPINWITFSILFLFFFFLNLTIYIILFKTSWPTPDFLRYFLLNYPLYFLNIGFAIFYSHPALSLSHFIKKKIENVENPSFLSSKIKIGPVFIFYILLVLVAFSGIIINPFLLWIIPALFFVFIEYLLLRFFIVILIRFSKDVKSFNMKLSVVPFFLIILCSFAFLRSPISSCTVGEFVCIAVKAANTNNISLCNKVANPSSPKDCYVFLAIANDDVSYCNYLNGEMNIAFCKTSVTNSSSGRKEYLKQYYSSELNQAKINK